SKGNLGSIEINHDREYERFLQALMLDGGWFYSEQRSDIFNLFSVSRLEKTSHFLVLRLLAYLNLDKNGSNARNVLKCETIVKDFVFLGYHHRHVNAALRRLLQYELSVSQNLKASFSTRENADIPDPL